MSRAGGSVDATSREGDEAAGWGMERKRGGGGTGGELIVDCFDKER